jgi:exosortase/archaeosortase family protein
MPLLATSVHDEPTREHANRDKIRSAMFASGGAMLGGLLLGKIFPGVAVQVFAPAAAWVAGFLTGSPVFRADDLAGWVVLFANAPVVVTTACSATDYFLIVAALIGFQAGRVRRRALFAAGIGLVAALPVAVFVNAIRIITVAYAHPWFISRLPATYGPFLHMLAGAAVFLPSLILLNLLLENYGRRRHLPT